MLKAQRVTKESLETMVHLEHKVDQDGTGPVDLLESLDHQWVFRAFCFKIWPIINLCVF